MNTLADLRLAPPVGVENVLCSRFRCTKSECSACADVCPVPGAVHFLEQGVEIAAGCVGCGACVSACPNGAVLLPEGDETLLKRIRGRIRPGEAFRIACGRVQGRVDLVLPCLGRLTEALVLVPILGGAERVELLDPGCSDCGLKKAALRWESVLTFTRAICESAELGADRIVRTEARTAKPLEMHEASGITLSRRKFFQTMADNWTRSTSPPGVRDTDPGKLPTTFRETVSQRRQNPKRAHLLRLLDAVPATKATSTTVPAAGIPLAELEVDRRCVGCNVCETLCPTGALRHCEAKGAYALEFEPALCTACGVCEAACFYKAIHFHETVDVSVLFTRPKVTLVSVRRQTCKACRETFLGKPADLCPLCQVSERRRALVARRILLGGKSA